MMLVPTLLATRLLAQSQNRVVDLSEVSRSIVEGRGDVPFNLLLLALGLFLLLLSGVSLFRAVTGGRWRKRPSWLAWQLARRVGLSFGELWLLHRIARHETLPSALVLMLSPSTLEHHSQQFTHGMSGDAKARYRAKIERIRHKIFGDMPADRSNLRPRRRVDPAVAVD